MTSLRILLVPDQGMAWQLHHEGMTAEHLGFIPDFVSSFDPRPAREQFNDNYGFAGGWSPFQGFSIQEDGTLLSEYGDPPLEVRASTRLRDEIIRFYDYSWVSITQPDGSFEISRMD